MRVLILGATGRTGSHVLSEALSRSHTITALVRRPEALTPHPSLSVQPGIPLSKTDIASAFASAPTSDPIKAVISTLNNGRSGSSPFEKPTAPPLFLATTARNVLEIMGEYGCRKIVVLGTNRVGSSRENSRWFFNFIIDYSALKVTFADHLEVENVLEEEGEMNKEFKWVSIRATGLSNSGKKLVREFGDDGKSAGWMISRKSVAGFMMDAVERNDWDGHTPVISN